MEQGNTNANLPVLPVNVEEEMKFVPPHLDPVQQGAIMAQMQHTIVELMCNVWSLRALKVLGWSLATPILRCSQGLQSAIGILLLCLVWTTDTVSNYPSYVEI